MGHSDLKSKFSSGNCLQHLNPGTGSFLCTFLPERPLIAQKIQSRPIRANKGQLRPIKASEGQ